MNPAALVTRDDTPYRMLGADCYDLASQGDGYRGGQPVIAHPFGHGASRSRHPTNRPRAADLDLALWALTQVQRWGGVLVQPANSPFWVIADLPTPGEHRDTHGGLTLPVWLSWFGHPTPRPTWLYIVGYRHERLPEIPIAFGFQVPAHQSDDCIPPALAVWLIELVQRISLAQEAARIAGEGPA